MQPSDEGNNLPDLEERRQRWRRIFAVLIMAGGPLVLFGLSLFVAFDGVVNQEDDKQPISRSVNCNDLLEDQIIYRVDPAQTTLNYEIDQQDLDSGDFQTATGQLELIEGVIVVDFIQPDASRVCHVAIDLTPLEEDEPLLARFLETETYGTAEFVGLGLFDFPKSVPIGRSFGFQVRGELTLKEFEAEEVWDVVVRLNDTEQLLIGSAEAVLLLSDYDIGPVRVAGEVESSDDISLTIDFVAEREEVPAE